MTDKELDDLEARLRKAAEIRWQQSSIGNMGGVSSYMESQAADAIAELREKNAALVERVGTLEGALHEAKLFVYGRSERLYQHLTHVLRTALEDKENTQ